jgi:hypothetical protein
MTTQQGKVTSEMLVKLAQERTLSAVFEKSWEEKMGVNPVAMAIQMNRRRQDDVFCFHELFIAGISFFFLIALAVFAANSKDGITSLGAMVHILCLVYTAIPVWIALLWLNRRGANPKITYSMDEFLADLNALCKWLNPESLSTDILLSSNEGVVKFAVNSLLVSDAISLVKLEQEKGKIAAERLGRICEMELARKRFTARHNTLARLGLVSGGFDKYFDEAKRQVKKTKATEAASPAAA